MQFKRRAVGEIIGALILIFIVSFSGAMLFSLSLRTSDRQGDILRSQIKEDGESAQERFTNLHTIIEESGGSYYLTVWIFNYGKIDCRIMDVYVKDPNAVNIIKVELNSGDGLVISTNKIEKIEFNINPSIVFSSFEINIVSERGVKHVSKWII